MNKQPDLPAGLLPTRDVRTRWNSTFDAVDRALRLKETILAYCNGNTEKTCPKLNGDVFTALSVMRPVLHHFLILTKRYSKSEPNIHRVIVDLHNIIKTLRTARDQTAPERRRSFTLALDKLTKYLKLMLQNDWVCAAMMLDPHIKQKGVQAVFLKYEELELGDRSAEVAQWIVQRAQLYQVDEESEELSEAEDEVTAPQPEDAFEVNEFAHFNAAFAAALPKNDSIKSAWDEYNSLQAQDEETYPKMGRNPVKKTMTVPEPILAYWKRQRSRNRRLVPLAKVAKDVLALAASSVEVERMFSVGGNTLKDKRKAMKPEMVLKHASLKIWGDQGFNTLKDIEALC
jgi:hypothetical protein